PPGHDDLVYVPGKQRAVRRVVVAPSTDRVWEVAPLEHVLLGDDVLALEQARLPDAELGRDIDEIAVSEAGKLGAREGHQGRDAPAALELGGGHVSHAERVVAGHVRAVAPDDAGQRRLEPPHVPRATEETLGLPV